MNILITGGTGFVGKHLTRLLTEQQHDVYILTRHKPESQDEPSVHYVEWLNDTSDPLSELPHIEMVYNLAGASINGGRWTSKQKEKILQSRLNATHTLIKMFKEMPHKPSVLVNASAVGYYGTSEKRVFTEIASYDPKEFLADVSHQWEQAALKAETMNIRTVLVRFGIVLGEENGVLPRMLLPYKFYCGGTIGSGDQWMSWIHINDLCRLLYFTAEHQSIAGPVNATAPFPVTMKTFGETLGEVLGKPHWLKVPSFVIKIALGEMSSLLLEGQNVIPKKASEGGFTFQYPRLDNALASLLKPVE